MFNAEAEAFIEHRDAERIGGKDCVLPCCECGKDSNAYASFEVTDTTNKQPTQWLCKECSNKQEGENHGE